MPKSRIPSPSRSQGVISTPRKRLRRTGSVGSPARTNLRLSTIIDSYKVSPVPNRLSVLNDDTGIEMPRRGSWWKKIDDNSRDVLELLDRKELVEINNVAEEFDVEVLSQENKNYALDLPESSDGESINSIVIPQRKLFTQKDNQAKKQFEQIKNNRETLQKINKSYQDKELNIGRKTLFSQPSKPRTKPEFPAALLNISANKTANKSKEIPAVEVKGQVRSLFGGRPVTKRKNMFADFIVSESEDEISEIQPQVFAFQKRSDQKRRASSMSRHSPTSSIDLEMEDWRLLPSSTLVENQIDEATSPVKRIKLNKLLENQDSEISTNANNTLNIIKQSKNKSKNLSNIHHNNDKSNDIPRTPKNATTNNSRVTRSIGRSFRENSVTATNISKNLNKSKNQKQSKKENNELNSSKTIKNITLKDSDTVQEKENMLVAHPLDPDENFTLEYENVNNEGVLEIVTSSKYVNKDLSHKDKTSSNLNVDIIVDKNNLINKSTGKISKDNLVELRISTNKICENQEELLENKQSDIDSNKSSNYSKIQNSSKEIENVISLNKESTQVQKLNKSIEKNKNKSITDSVENYEEHSKAKDVQRETFSQEQSVNEDIEQNEKLEKSTQNSNQENREDQEIESNIEDNQNIYEQHTDMEEEANDSTEVAEHGDSENEEEMNEDVDKENDSQSENISKEEAGQEETNANDTDERGKAMILDEHCNNIKDKSQVTLHNISHDTTGKNRKKSKSPEVILHDKRKQIDSFTVQGRNTSVRKTKSIIFHNKFDTIADLRKSTGFSDATVNSSAEGSGWDSHRTTRKTLRQTFGKDFTPRKSLRALVMEKTAKLQGNFTELVDNTKIPQANSTEYDQVHDELDSYQEMELVQVEHNIKMAQAEERIEAIHIEQNVTEQLEEGVKTVQLEVRNITEQIEERYEADQPEEIEETEEKDQTEHFEEKVKESEEEKVDDSEEEENVDDSEKEAVGKFAEREEIQESEEREELEDSEEKEEVVLSKAREVMEESEEGEEIEQFEEREEMEESVGRDYVEQTKAKEEMDKSEEEEKEQSEEREIMEESEEEEEEIEHSEDREVMEESEEGEEIEQFEEREEMDKSEEEEMEQSEEREIMEESEEEEEEIEQSEDREVMEESEEGEEIEQFEEREEMDESEEVELEHSEEVEMEQSEEREVMDESQEGEEMEQPEEREEIEQSENEERDETNQFVDRDENETEQFEESDETVADEEKMAEVSDREMSKHTRQTSLEIYLHKIKQDNAEKRRKMQEQLRNSLKNPKRDAFNLFKVPQRPVQHTIKMQKPKAKQIKNVIPVEMLPSEVIEDMKYKPPKRFQPNNASWITKRLYKFLENKLEPKYDYKARIRAEKLVQCIYNFTKEVRRHDSTRFEGIEELKREMARLDIVKTHFDFYEFCHEFFPREIRIKIVPDIVNKIQLPRLGVFSDILR